MVSTQPEIRVQIKTIWFLLNLKLEYKLNLKLVCTQLEIRMQVETTWSIFTFLLFLTEENGSSQELFSE